MRNLYGSRQSLLLETARAELSGLLEIQESEAGMHLVGWLPPGVSDTEAARVASAHNVLALPLSAFTEACHAGRADARIHEPTSAKYAREYAG